MYEKLLKITEECGANTFGGKTGMDRANGDMHTPPKKAEGEIEEEDIFKPAGQEEPRTKVAKDNRRKEKLEILLGFAHEAGFRYDINMLKKMSEEELDKYDAEHHDDMSEEDAMEYSITMHSTDEYGNDIDEEE